MLYNSFFICLLPAISKCTLWLAILPIELDAKHWYSPTSVLFFARLWITLVIINAPLDAIRLLESAMIFSSSFSHVILEGGGEPCTRQFNVTGSFLRATVFVGSLAKPRGTKGPEKAPEIMFSTKLVGSEPNKALPKNDLFYNNPQTTYKRVKRIRELHCKWWTFHSKVAGTSGHCFDAYRIISANPPSKQPVGRKFLQLFDKWIATTMQMATFTYRVIPRATASKSINFKSAAVTPPCSYAKVPE